MKTNIDPSEEAAYRALRRNERRKSRNAALIVVGLLVLLPLLLIGVRYLLFASGLAGK